MKKLEKKYLKKLTLYNVAKICLNDSNKQNIFEYRKFVNHFIEKIIFCCCMFWGDNNKTVLFVNLVSAQIYPQTTDRVVKAKKT